MRNDARLSHVLGGGNAHQYFRSRQMTRSCQRQGSRKCKCLSKCKVLPSSQTHHLCLEFQMVSISHLYGHPVALADSTAPLVCMVGSQTTAPVRMLYPVYAHDASRVGGNNTVSRLRTALVVFSDVRHDGVHVAVIGLRGGIGDTQRSFGSNRLGAPVAFEDRSSGKAASGDPA